MLLCALRYCMGRQSYAVSVCCDFLRDHWKDIDDGTKRTMIRDLEHDLKECEADNRYLGADFDHRAWRTLLDFMQKNAPPPIKF